MTVERCPLCGGTAGARIGAREMMQGLRHEFTYARCGSCGSLWLQDPPADLGPYYADGYYSLVPDPKGAARTPGAALWASVLLRLPEAACARLEGRPGFPRYARWFAGLRLTTRSRIADVGCGAGHLVDQLARHGFHDVWGVDPYLPADRDAGAAHLRRGSLDRAEGSFDLIAFNHALEHIADPVDALRDARSRLSAGGTVLVRIPVAGSFADRRYGADWVALDAPRHLSIPSRRGMEAAAACAGLRIERVFFDSEALQFWASEQYARDLALREPGSGCPPGREAQLARRARELNARGDGDTAGFVLVPTAAGG